MLFFFFLRNYYHHDLINARYVISFWIYSNFKRQIYDTQVRYIDSFLFTSLQSLIVNISYNNQIYKSVNSRRLTHRNWFRVPFNFASLTYINWNVLHVSGEGRGESVQNLTLFRDRFSTPPSFIQSKSYFSFDV